MYWYDSFIDEMKELILKRKELQLKIIDIKKSIKGGANYFAVRQNKSMNSALSTELLKGSERMCEIIAELESLQNEIFDLDTIIVSKLEAYMSNFEAKFSMPTRMNDAGDIIKYDDIYAVAVKQEDRREVTPDDIWFLKMIKDAFKATNVAFVEK